MLTRHWQRLLFIDIGRELFRSLRSSNSFAHSLQASRSCRIPPRPTALNIHKILATNTRGACAPRASFVPLAGSFLLLVFIFQLLRCMRNIPVVSLVICVFFEARVVGRVFEHHD